jgi:hypothetical protein
MPSSNRALLSYLRPSRQRDNAHKPIDTGLLRGRRKFGYRGGQMGQSARSVWRLFRRMAKEQYQGREFGFPCYQAARFSSAETTICCDRFRSLHRGQPHCARNSPSRRAPSDLPSDAGPGGCRTNMHCHRSMAESSPAIACSFETNSPANLSHRFERRQV